MRSDMLRFVQKDFLISVLNEMHNIAKQNRMNQMKTMITGWDIARQQEN